MTCSLNHEPSTLQPLTIGFSITTGTFVLTNCLVLILLLLVVVSLTLLTNLATYYVYYHCCCYYYCCHHYSEAPHPKHPGAIQQPALPAVQRVGAPGELCGPGYKQLLVFVIIRPAGKGSAFCFGHGRLLEVSRPAVERSSPAGQHVARSACFSAH